MSLKSKAYKLTALSLLLAPMALSTVQGTVTVFADDDINVPSPPSEPIPAPPVQPAPEGQVNIGIYKLLNTDKSDVQNTGLIMNDSDFYDNGKSMIRLPGVTFEAYDISDLYHAKRTNDKLSAEEATAAIEKMNINTIIADRTAVQTSITGEYGRALFNGLSKTSVISDGEKEKTVDAVYIFVETKAPEIVTQKAAPMVVALPAYAYEYNEETGKYVITEHELSAIHLYPKNESTVGSLQGEKVIKNYNPESGEIVTNPLAGAKFLIHKDGTNIADYDDESEEKVFLGPANDDTKVREWVTYAEAIAAGEDTVFTTDADGELNIPNLAEGSYRISEISTEIDNNSIGKTNSVIDRDFIIGDFVDDEKVYNIDLGTLTNDDIVVEKDNPGGSLTFGEAETYTVKTMVPSGMNDTIVKNGEVEDLYSHFTFTDIHDEWLVLDEDSITVTVGENEISPDEYSVSPVVGAGVEKAGFSINFEDPRDTLGQYAGQIIQVSYDMSIDPGATADVNFDNLVKVSTDWDYNTDKGEKVFTGGRKFIKVDGHSNARLNGAKFNVMQGENYLYEDENGNYKFSASKPENYTLVELESKSATIDGTVVNGLFEIQGLKYGTYQLKEIAVPDESYILPDGTFTFTVSKDSYSLIHDSITEERIKNFSKGTLPSTGGMGTIVFFLVGAVAMTGVVAVSRKKKA